MKHTLSTALTSLLLASPALAQFTEDISSFRPWRSSHPEGWRLFDKDWNRSIPCRNGFWIEVDLTRDEMGNMSVLNYLSLECGSTGNARVTALVRQAPSSAWIPFWSGNLNSRVSSVLTGIPASSLRLQHDGISGSSEIFEIWGGGRPAPRLLSPQHVSWYGASQPAGSLATLSVLLRSDEGDDLACLLCAVGSPLLSSALRLDPTWAGGLLLDPTILTVLGVRPVAGGVTWTTSWFFPYDPSLSGVPWHLQGLVITLVPSGAPHLLFTRALSLEG